MVWQERIRVDPAVCHGKACIRGTRVTVAVVLANLADGETTEAIARGYHITVEDVSAALQYAAQMAQERIVDVPAEAP